MKKAIILASMLISSATFAATNNWDMAVYQTNVIVKVRLETANFNVLPNDRLRVVLMPTAIDDKGREARWLPRELNQDEIRDACATNGVVFAKFRAILQTLAETVLSK